MNSPSWGFFKTREAIGLAFNEVSSLLPAHTLVVFICSINVNQVFKISVLLFNSACIAECTHYSAVPLLLPGSHCACPTVSLNQQNVMRHSATGKCQIGTFREAFRLYQAPPHAISRFHQAGSALSCEYANLPISQRALPGHALFHHSTRHE